MEPFVKLKTSILDSTIWNYDAETRVVWITMLAMADHKGRVHAAIPGIAHRARVSINAVERALERFQSPDPYSRTADHEGCRVRRDGRDWLILNYGAHRDVDPNEKERERKRRWWRENRGKNEKTKSDSTLLDASTVEWDEPSTPSPLPPLPQDPDPDPETETEKKAEKARPPARKGVSYTKEFERFWEAYPPRKGTKSGKKPAFEVWQKLKDRPPLEALIHAIGQQKKTEKWMDGFIPDARRWLRDRGWEDVVLPQNTKASSGLPYDGDLAEKVRNTKK